MKKRIVITGGHLTPAMAVIDELVKEDRWQVLFLGRKYASEQERTPSVESLAIPDRGIRFKTITAGRFFPYFNRYALLAFLKIPLGFFQALYHLLCFRPQVILSFGGYLSVPVVLMGWLLGIPSLTHEQTTVRGLATRINSFFAKKVAVSWPESLKSFSKEKVILTGNPIRKETFKTNEKVWRALAFPSDLPLVFVTGGNQGAHVINLAIKSILPRLLKIANVFHQSGHLQALGDFEVLEEARRKLSPELRKRYHFKKYLTPEEMGTFLKKADLVVSRAGINTLTEVAALAKPALLVPLPWLYQGEQTKNAQMLVDIGMAEVLSQKDLSAKKLYRAIKIMIEKRSQYEKRALAAKKLVKLNAAKKIIAEVKKLL